GRLVREGQLAGVARGAQTTARERKRILVVEDSLTVRELERKLLEKRGYAVTVAVDGMDGWNTLRTGQFDLVITDVDMPRMDGIELVTMIRSDPQQRAVPVMIVSYKDREDDRRRGLDAGADYYLTKGSFHDEALLDAVNDLIGEAT
ncbi:MAG: response regulator, partial [Paraburkholderia tropica]